MHRGLTNSYLSGNNDFKKELLHIEPKIIQNMQSFSRKNSDILKKLQALELFSNLEKETKSLFIQNIDKKDYPSNIFNKHTVVINQLIILLQKISDKYKLGINDNLTLKHMTKILTDKLLALQENTGVLRGLATVAFEEKTILKSQKNRLLSLYAHINILQKDPATKETHKYISQFPEIKNILQLMKYRLSNLLYIVHYHLFITDKPDFDAKQFFKLATETIETQYQLYHKLTEKYEELLNQLHQKHLHYTMGLIIGFIIILLTVIYLATAFYYSVTRSIRKLQTASNMIANGNTKITLKSDTEDEVSDALEAFQSMSTKLGENISFLNSYKTAIDETSIVSKTDPKGIITYANKKFCSISGYTLEELIGKPHNIVRHKDMPKEAFKDMWQTIKSGNIWHGIVKNRTKTGNTYIVDAMIMPIFDNNNNIIEYIGIRHDITELEESKATIEEEMQKQKIDPITGLANRIQLIEDLQLLKKPVLLYLNIDDFTNLNDFYGAEAGNKVLRFVANLLQVKLPQEIKLYRLQSDEFLLLFEEGTHENPQKLLEEIIDYIETQTNNCDQQSCISITLTGSLTSYHQSKDFENLLSYVSLARKIAQKEHKKYLLYNENMHKNADYQNNMKWINKIKEALQEDRIVAFFQPIIENRSGEIHKYEALVRMVEKDGTIVSPFFFLEIAKKAKLYTQITKVMFDKAFEMFKESPEYDFSINITVEDIEDDEIATYIFHKLKHFPYPQNVILEITESEEIKDYEQVNNFIKEAKTMGVQIAIDDFGSGYSNFAHIISMDADFIKIDGSLIKNIDKDEEARIITEAIIAFSKKLGAQTVVEFVHNQTVYDIVREIGADYSQGFYLGEPAAQIQLQEAVL
jgi:PAS domain S-box-containing protein/diguanylate cyclase (GGDEF)-like protein